MKGLNKILCSIIVFLCVIIITTICAKINSYVIVSFNTVGGNTIESRKLIRRERIGKLPMPIKDGYDFLYWSIKDEQINENYMVDKDIVLMANWIEQVNNFDESKYDNGKQETKDDVNFKNKEHENIDKKETINNTNEKERKEDYKNTDDDNSNYEESSYKNDNLNKPNNINQTEEKSLDSTNVYIVTFNTNGGNQIAAQFVHENDSVAKPSVPFKEGYTFEKWTLNGEDYDFNAKINDNITLDANYSRKKCMFAEHPLNYMTHIEGLYRYRYYYGWSVELADKTSSNPVTEAPCAYINSKPVLNMSNLFADSNARIIDVSNFDTSMVKNMSNMFSNVKTTKIDGLEKLNTSNVLYMDGMFANSNLFTIDLSGFDTRNVTNMSNMFYNAKATEIKGLEKLNTSNVTNMEAMLAYTNISSIDVSNYNTSKVNNMAKLFGWSMAVEIKGLEKLNTSNVTNMEAMFANVKIPMINVSYFNTSKVINMNRLFAASKAIEIKGLEKLDTSNVTDMYGMFSNSSVKKINVSYFNTEKVTNMSNMFYNAKAIEIIGLGNFNTKKVAFMDDMFSGVKNMDLDLSSFDTTSVITMSGMFENSEMGIIDISSFDTKNVSVMKRMFANSRATEIKGIENISFNYITLNGIEGIFANSKVKVIDLRKVNTKNLNVNNIFNDCEATVGYARKKEDAEKLNASIGKPDSLVFIHKYS